MKTLTRFAALFILSNAVFLFLPLNVIAQSDTDPPEIVDVVISPDSIDISSGPQTITVTATATDDVSGVREIYLVLRSPSGTDSQGISLFEDDLISGTLNNGVFQTTFTFPQFQEPGIWDLVHVGLGDFMPRFNNYSSPAELAAVGIDEELVVENPTLIQLSSIIAQPGSNRVTLIWETVSEIENAGFNLYRAEVNGEYVRINDSIIPAKGSLTEGASYSFNDNDVQNRKTYSYKLEDIDLNGVATEHGPVIVTPRLIYGIGQ